MVLTSEEIAAKLEELGSGWSLSDNAIRKQFTFRDFPEAIEFVNRLVPHAEQADHHPDILVNYRRVTLMYSTHSEGAITQKDFDGAAMAERMALQQS